MRVFLPQKSVPAASALICLIAILPALTFAQDFDGGGFDFGSDAGGFDFGGGDFFGGDTGGSFGGDTGITFSEDVGGFFGGDTGVAFEDSGSDSGFSFGEDTGITFGEDTGISFGGDAGGPFGDDTGSFFGDDTDTVPGVDFNGVDVGGGFGFGFGFDSDGITDFDGLSGASLASGGSFELQPAPPAPGPAPATSIIAETSFSEPTAPAAIESVPFFPTAGPEPFFFSGSEPLPVLSISEPLQSVTLHRSSITLAEIPYTGVGGVFAMAAFILGVLGLSGITAYWLMIRFGPRQNISPEPPRWETWVVFASW